jgi:hypothetical protein
MQQANQIGKGPQATNLRHGAFDALKGKIRNLPKRDLDELMAIHGPDILDLLADFPPQFSHDKHQRNQSAQSPNQNASRQDQPNQYASIQSQPNQTPIRPNVQNFLQNLPYHDPNYPN